MTAKAKSKTKPARKRAARKPVARRKNKSKYALTKCPVKGCTHMKGKPQEGTVPGVKRHVWAIHVLRDATITEAQYEKLKFGDLYTKPAGKAVADSIKGSDGNGSGVPTDLASLPVPALRERAKAKGISVTGKRKDELVEALS
jgi:hypothetical protein